MVKAHGWELIDLRVEPTTIFNHAPMDGPLPIKIWAKQIQFCGLLKRGRYRTHNIVRRSGMDLAGTRSGGEHDQNTLYACMKFSKN